MAGKERAGVCRMAVEEGVRPCMEGIIAVGRHLPGAVLCQSSAGLMMRANSKSRTCLGRAGTASCCVRAVRCFSLMSGVWTY